MGIEPTIGAGGPGMTVSAFARVGGPPRFTDNALVALALLVAERDPAHKPLMARVILGVLGGDAT